MSDEAPKQLAKMPAFQFYPADWRKDPGIQSLDYEARGVWLEMLCLMHESEDRGILTLNSRRIPEEIVARMLGIEARKFRKILAQLVDFGVARLRESDGAIYSKRMVRDEEIRRKRAEGGASGSEHGHKGAEHGHKGGRPRTTEKPPINGNGRGDKKPPLEHPINPPPSSSSSSSSSFSSTEESEIAAAASYDQEQTCADTPPERSSKQPPPDLEERNGFPSLDHFLGLAAVAGIPEDFASALHSDMSAKGWIAGNGKPVGALSMFLRAAWDKAKPREQGPVIEGGPRQAWQIDADIARVQAEIKRLNSDPDRKNAAHGHKESRDDYRKRREPEYLATVKELMAQARTAFTAAEFEGFEKSLANLRDEMRKGAAMLGRDVKEVDSEDVAAVHFAEYFPKDCPNFDLWDREWTESTWRDPNALTAEAKVEVRELKAALKRLEGERRRALV